MPQLAKAEAEEIIRPEYSPELCSSTTGRPALNHSKWLQEQCRAERQLTPAEVASLAQYQRVVYGGCQHEPMSVHGEAVEAALKQRLERPRCQKPCSRLVISRSDWCGCRSLLSTATLGIPFVTFLSAGDNGPLVC